MLTGGMLGCEVVVVKLCQEKGGRRSGNEVWRVGKKERWIGEFCKLNL
jgi:hypothetical protein